MLRKSSKASIFIKINKALRVLKACIPSEHHLNFQLGFSYYKKLISFQFDKWHQYNNIHLNDSEFVRYSNQLKENEVTYKNYNPMHPEDYLSTLPSQHTSNTHVQQSSIPLQRPSSTTPSIEDKQLQHPQLKRRVYGCFPSKNSIQIPDCKNDEKEDCCTEASSTKRSVQNKFMENISQAMRQKLRREHRSDDGRVEEEPNMQKFISYIIKFKLQMANSYNPANDDVNTKNTLNLVQYKHHLEAKNNIHENYKCDGCQMEPIVGTRYHCNQAECKDDFDLCEECACDHNHKHLLFPINKNALNSHIQVVEGLIERRKMKVKQWKSNII